LPGVPNLALVESAIARPYSGYYRPIERKAAAPVQSVASNHGFADGNKRTALILLYTLLLRSGFQLHPSHASEPITEAVEDMILCVAEGRMRFDEIVDWFKLRIKRIS